MPSITITLGDAQLVIHGQPDHGDLLNNPEGQQQCCQGAEPGQADHDNEAAVCLAKAAEQLRLALCHADNNEIRCLILDAERLTAEYLAGAN